MTDQNESSHFLLQPLNFDTTTPSPPGTGKAGYRVNQSDASKGRHNKVTSATSGNCGHDEDTRSLYDGHGTEACIENTGLLIREIQKADNETLPNKQPNNIFPVWSLELALLLLATGLLGSIFTILGSYNTHEMPDWNAETGVGITLNALIAVIATIFRAILAFVALEVLAQLKWDWITKTFRPMNDMQRYDDASRGAWGSLMLLPVIFKNQPQAIVAVIVVVASLAIGPVTQQTIQPYYCTKIAPERLATITVANKLDAGRLYYDERPSAWKLHVGLEAAIQDAVINPSQSSNIEDLFNCPSGNCTFQAYPDKPGQPDQERISHASLGMCSRCEDISKLVQIRMEYSSVYSTDQAILSMAVPSRFNESGRVEIRSGGEAENARYFESKVAGNFSWADKALPKDFLNTARWSAANLTMLAFSQQNCQNGTDGNISCPLVSAKANDPVAWEQPTGYVAAACILYPCIKHYSGIVRSGALSERVVKSTPLRVQMPWPLADSYADEAALGVTQPLQGVQFPCFVNDTLYTSINMTAESKKLPESARQSVLIHSKNWENQSLDTQIGYNNITAPNECIMTLRHLFIHAFRRSLSETFNAYCRPQGFQTDFLSCYTASEASSLPMVSILRTRSTSIKTIKENMDSMALRITTEFRRAGLGVYGDSSAIAKGDVLENRSCLRVAWKWLVLPAVLLLVCMMLIVWLMMRELVSRGNRVVWKGSILPFLLHDKVPTWENMSLKELNLASKKLEIKLEN